MDSFDKGLVRNMCLTAAFGSLQVGYQLAVFNEAQENVAYTLGWTDSTKSTLTSLCSALVPVGAIVGSSAAGKLARSFGRRKTLMIGDAIAIIACIINIIPTSFTFALGRFLGGVFGGMGCSTLSMYVVEMSPKEVLGAYGSLVGIGIAGGELVAFLIAIPLPSDDYTTSMNNYWYFCFLVPVIFALIQGSLFLFVYNYETPRWLLDKERPDEAKMVLGLIYSQERATLEFKQLEKKEEEVDEILSETSQEPLVGKKTHHGEIGYLDLLKPPLRDQVIVCCVLAMFNQLSGINVIIFFSNVIFKSFESAGTAHLMTTLLGIWLFISTLFTLKIADMFDRKILLLQGAIGMATCHCLIAISLFFNANAWIVFFFILAFLTFYNNSFATILWVYLSERMVDKALGIACSVKWITACVVVGTVLTLDVDLGLSDTFLLYSFFNVLSVIFVFLNVETSTTKKIAPLD